MEGLQDDAHIYVLLMDKEAEWCSVPIETANIAEDGADEKGVFNDCLLLYIPSEEL